jgi:hypothetical protein
MEKLISLVMYVLWTVTIIMILAATFTNFQNEDLNIMAVVLLVFSSLNSFFIFSRKR